MPRRDSNKKMRKNKKSKPYEPGLATIKQILEMKPERELNRLQQILDMYNELDEKKERKGGDDK